MNRKNSQMRRFAGLGLLAVASIVAGGWVGCSGGIGIGPINDATTELDPGPFSDSGAVAINTHHSHSAARKRRVTSAHRPAVTPAVTPQPSLAPFFGNLSVVSSPTTGLFLQRQSNCSLTFTDYSENVVGNMIDVTMSTMTPGYEKVIHDSAFLTTTPDVFPNGCVDVNQGVASQIYVYLGPSKTAGEFLVATAASGNVDTFQATGQQMTFALSTQATDFPAVTLASGDLNKDGAQDLVSFNTDGLNSSVSIILGNGDGTYKPATNLDLPNQVIQFGAVDDVNNDGKLDVVVSGGAGFLVYLGKGDGTFQSPVTVAPANGNFSFNSYLITADVNHDGVKDIIAANGQVFLGQGNGTTFTVVTNSGLPSTQGSSRFGPGMIAADFNGDGKLDFATDDGATVHTYLGNGDGTFKTGPAYATIPNRGYLIATDIDGDGNLDIFSAYTGNGAYAGDDFIQNQVYPLMGNGNGTFQGAPSLPFKYTGTNLLDLNNDGRPDLVDLPLNSIQTTLTTYLTGANGIPVAGPSQPISTPNGVDSFALGDFSGDKIPDLIYLSAGPQIQLFNLAIGIGDGSFAVPTSFPVPSLVPAGLDINESLTGVRAADFNHDGKMDIAYSFSDQSSTTQLFYEGFAVQLGNGDGTFQPPQIVYTYQNANAPAVFPSNMLSAIYDVTKDSFPDVFMVLPTVIANGEAQHQVMLFVGNGDGTFKAPNTITVTPNVLPSTPDGGFGSPFAFADLNGDGKVDMVTGGASTDGTTPQLAITLGNGDGTFQPPTILNFNGFGFVDGVVLADFDGDGKIDLEVQTGIEGTGTGIFPGKGDGTFTTIPNGDGTVSSVLQIPLAAFGSAVAVDLNHDGAPDLFSGGVVLLNKFNSIAPVLAPTSTAISSSLNPSTSGASVTFTATVTSTTAGTITGTVTFLDGANTIGMGTVGAGGVATFMTSTLSVASHSITAQYGGDTNFATSTSPVVTQVVNAGSKASTTTGVTSSPNPSTSGASVTFTATVTSATAGTITGTVTFLDGATSFGMGTVGAGGVATAMTSSLTAGNHSITAQYGGDTNYAGSTSSAVMQTVNAAATGDFSVSANPTSVTVAAGQDRHDRALRDAAKRLDPNCYLHLRRITRRNGLRLLLTLRHARRHAHLDGSSNDHHHRARCNHECT